MEQRQSERYKASFPVEVGSDGGLTIDISSSGIAFESSKPFKIGQELSLRILMSRGDSPWPMQLECRGKVVRNDPHDGVFTVGATIEWLDREEEGMLFDFI